MIKYSRMTTFNENLREIYDMVSARFDHIVITGSSALLFILFNNNIDVPPELIFPNDIDFLVVQNTDITIRKIDTFVSEQDIASSKTFSDGVQSFDIIKCKKVKYINIDGVDVIDPLTLLKEYKSDNRDKDQDKIKILEKYREIFSHIECREYNIKPKKDIEINGSPIKKMLSFD